LAKRAGAYRSEKRKKEIGRQKKQEEKRLKRLKKVQGGAAGEELEGEPEEQAGVEPEAGAETEGTSEGEGQ
jgi:hypothetical protein